MLYEVITTSDEIQGTVRIAAFTSALEKIVIPAVSKLSKMYPKLQIRLTEMEPDVSIVITSYSIHYTKLYERVTTLD